MFTLRWGEVEGTPEHALQCTAPVSATVLLAKLTFSVYLMAYTRGWCLMLKPAPASHTDQFPGWNWNIEIYAVLYQLTFRPIFVRLKKSPLRTDKIDWTDNDWQHPAFYYQIQAEQLQSLLAISLQSIGEPCFIMIFPPIYAVKLPLFYQPILRSVLFSLL